MRTYELLAKLLIVLLSAFGIMRGSEWIVRGEASMKNASKLYIELSQYVDLKSLGWLLVIFSIMLLISVFISSVPAFVLMAISGLVVGSIHVFYGIIATEGAKVVATYYTTLTLGIYQYIICAVGVINLWKIKRKQK